MDSLEHQTLLPLDESWRRDRGMELYEVPCAKRCGNIFGNQESASEFFVCSDVATGTCCFAVCKECYSVAFSDRPGRGKKSRIRSSRLVG